MKPRIFISSVTSELGTSRQLVANVLSRLGYDPVWQDIFGLEPGDLRQVLREKIDDCDGLIQLVGRGYGAEPPTVDAEFGRVSYTQFEFLYARARGKKTWLIFADEGCTRDRPLDELDRSHDPQHPDPVAYQAERRALQEQWRQLWMRESHLFHGATSDTDLELRVERMRDEFAELRREFRWWQRSVTRNLTVVAALVLLSVGIGLFVARQQLQAVKAIPEDVTKKTGEQVDQARMKTDQKIESTARETKEGIKDALHDAVKELTNPVVLAERIRKEIHATAEEKIKALPDENGRGRMIAEIEKERDLALGRVDDLVKLIQEGLKEGASPVFQRAAEILQKEGTDAALEYLESRRPSTLETARRHAEQAKTAQGRADSAKVMRNKSLQALVLEAELLETKLQWNPALHLREQVADLAPDWFEARNYLGILYFTLARYKDAEPHRQAAVKLAVTPGDEAIALNNLATLFQTTNRRTEAAPLMRRALAINIQCYGAEHPYVAVGLNNLAQLLTDTNRREEAEPLMRRALAIFEQTYGAQHASVATNLSNLARFLQDTNRLAEAEPLMRRALAIDEQFYGAEHPEVAHDLNNLANLLKATNRLAKAEPLYHAALAIDEKSYGAEHPAVARELHNLAVCLQATNRLSDAESLMRRALAIDEKSYGAEHPRVAVGLNNLASLINDTNRLAEAEPLMRRALVIDEKAYGAEHPDVGSFLWSLAALLRDTNRLDAAVLLMRRALSNYQRFAMKTGHAHPHWKTALEQYRSMLQIAKRPPEVIEELIGDATITTGPLWPIVPEVERLLGPAKPVAEVLAALNRQYKADSKPAVYFLPTKEPISPHLDKLLQPNPDSLNSVGVNLYRNGDHATAVAYYDESLKLLAHKPDKAATSFMTRMNRAAALRELGEAEQARDELRKLLANMKVGDVIPALSKGRARYHLALCEWRMGDRDAAQHEAEESLKEYGDDATSAAMKKQTEQLLADLKDNKPLPPLAKGDAVAALEQARGRFRARADLATLPLNQSAVPLLDQMLGPAPSTREVFETLDRQYREQHKPEIWFLPLNKPIAPHLDELLGPVPKKDKE